eukprot:8860596-Pyramimonas_sp.AAC.1
MAAGFPRNPSCPSGRPNHLPVRAGKFSSRGHDDGSQGSRKKPRVRNGPRVSTAGVALSDQPYRKPPTCP